METTHHVAYLLYRAYSNPTKLRDGVQRSPHHNQKFVHLKSSYSQLFGASSSPLAKAHTDIHLREVVGEEERISPHHFLIAP